MRLSLLKFPRIFTSTIFCLLAALPAGLPQAATCAADHIDERAVVASVYDGDTLRLQDRRSVRLIGVNASEIAQWGKKSSPEPHAIEARDALRKLLPVGGVVALRFDEDAHDHYGRLLAHVYTASGESVQARLLEDGHVFRIMVPPNNWNLDCYGRAEERARARNRGVWAMSEYRPVEARSLAPDAGGFHLIRGTVRKVNQRASGVWLDLDNDISLRINKADLDSFKGVSLARLQGREIVARGWLIARKGQHAGRMMLLRHPGALESRFADAPADH